MAGGAWRRAWRSAWRSAYGETLTHYTLTADHGSLALDATTLTDVYTVPSTLRNGIRYLKGLFVCNRGAATTFRISYAPLGAADDVSQYLCYDVAIGANETFNASFEGFRLSATDVIRAYAGTADVSVTVLSDNRA